MFSAYVSPNTRKKKNSNKYSNITENWLFIVSFIYCFSISFFLSFVLIIYVLPFEQLVYCLSWKYLKKRFHKTAQFTIIHHTLEHAHSLKNMVHNITHTHKNKIHTCTHQIKERRVKGRKICSFKCSAIRNQRNYLLLTK